MPYQIINDLRIYYEWHGSEQGFPVVCINGLLSDTTSWGFQIPGLAPHYRVLIYDCRGQGRSEKPPGPYTQATHAADLLALLDALQVPQAHMIGLSNGGTVAMTFALSHPHRVRRLVLADTFAHADAVMQTKLHSWLLAMENGNLAMRFDVALPWVWSRTFIAQNAEVIELLRQRSASADIAAVQSLIRGTLDYDIRDRLPEIQHPALVVVGEEDVLTPPWYSRQLATLLPNARLVQFAEVGHALPIESPALFNAVALAFLQEDQIY